MTAAPRLISPIVSANIIAATRSAGRRHPATMPPTARTSHRQPFPHATDYLSGAPMGSGLYDGTARQRLPRPTPALSPPTHGDTPLPTQSLPFQHGLMKDEPTLSCYFQALATHSGYALKSGYIADDFASFAGLLMPPAGLQLLLGHWPGFDGLAN